MFDNDDPLQRERLVQLLHSIGLEAAEFCSGGGIMHIVVPLLDGQAAPAIINAHDPDLRTTLEVDLKEWPFESSLYIATNSLRTTCEVGLMGNNGKTGAQATSTQWDHADSLEEAVSQFRQRWEDRDKWLVALVCGDLDVI